MLRNNFGLFGNFKRARWLLKRFHEITSLKGRIVETEVPEHLAYQEINRERGRMSGQVRIRVRFRKYASPWFEYFMVSKKEMKDILDSTGWEARRFMERKDEIYIAIIEKT